MKKRDRELADLLSAYVDVLNEHGVDSPREVAFRRRKRSDPELIPLLEAARAMKIFFQALSPSSRGVPRSPRPAGLSSWASP